MPRVFLMTDVVGSTALWERHEHAMPTVSTRHDEIVHGVVGVSGGRVFKHTGDGMIAAFDDAEPAIVAARDACEGLATESMVVPDRIRIRTSLHAGPATERDGDLFGPALNRVARINGVAHPDQILASDLTVTLGLRCDELVNRARAVLGDRVDDLLTQGAADGEESTVAEAHAIIRGDGLNVD